MDKLKKLAKELLQDVDELEENGLDPTPRQARALFTAIIIASNSDVDTNYCDDLLGEFYEVIAKNGIDYYEFEEFMLKDLV